MKRFFYTAAYCLIAGSLISCGGNSKKASDKSPSEAGGTVSISYSRSLKSAESDTLSLPVDADGYITIFDGKDLKGWRGYGKDKVPARWVIEDGCLKFNGSGGGEAQAGDGGDLIFAHKFKNRCQTWQGQ